MSASPVARQATNCQFIPSRRVVLNDPSQLPIDYASTPGGTLYSTTPGGTRIVYERAFLMNLRNSPLGRTPPKTINSFPSELLQGSQNRVASKPAPPPVPESKVEPIEEGAEQFEMDI